MAQRCMEPGPRQGIPYKIPRLRWLSGQPRLPPSPSPKHPTGHTHLAIGPTHRFLNAAIPLADVEECGIGDIVRVEDWDGKSVATGARVVAFDTEGEPIVELPGGERRTVDLDAEYCTATQSAALTKLWETEQKQGVPDGVAWADQAVPDDLVAQLNATFDAMIENEIPDYHPGSNDTVRDLVHPSLYSFVRGVTPIRTASGAALRSHTVDFWGRPFESSRYQWLPADVRITDDGEASFESYINNLDWDRYRDAYSALAQLLSNALPLLESVWGYAKSTKFLGISGEDDAEHELPNPRGQVAAAPAPAPISLRGRTLQVITKMVEYQIGPENGFEGVWHVEGMSHERIVATCVFVRDRDAALDGGSIRFKRAYTAEEAGQLFWNVPQCRSEHAEELFDEGMIPIGSLDTPKGRMFVFPNSHVHKLSAMRSTAGVAKRRVIVFWLVDPDSEVLSTSDVAPQQFSMDRADALAHRLKLMEERRLHKQTMNVRAVSLCEH